MNKRGQALVEFVIILPIFIFMILAAIDVGKILYMEEKLENKMEDVIAMYRDNNSQETILENLKKDIAYVNLEIKEDDKYIEFKIYKDVSIITPGLNFILDNPYEVVSKRVIYNA